MSYLSHPLTKKEILQLHSGDEVYYEPLQKYITIRTISVGYKIVDIYDENDEHYEGLIGDFF